MDVSEEPHKKLQKKKNPHKWDKRISFAACLPDDVCGVFAGSICAVKYSTDPFKDLRESILEMIQDVGVCDWNDIEELVYCYIALNSAEFHEIIGEAFLSLCSCCFAKMR
ncbi:hypothetical protein I3843_05G186000 [Carya illinoinensis]|uniref:Transcription repressor n=1 Tax=Carya illinoinensis TaxID=32201 RepID=A0A8T1QLZ4_CARIL|nr:hypothetical protein I3760_05G204500 [Carya illinoinensis]KAG6655313.1 hypothetical protein CIPAW_05G207300 [Carya illinoinensis]KAG6714423.1 hypothetical protein I3842_05G201800 [Carya illinoinensis]KAG7980511.1 hypothetical protein I3843_05G186000 [Carya illinoinensis]